MGNLCSLCTELNIYVDNNSNDIATTANNHEAKPSSHGWTEHPWSSRVVLFRPTRRRTVGHGSWQGTKSAKSPNRCWGGPCSSRRAAESGKAFRNTTGQRWRSTYGQLTEILRFRDTYLCLPTKRGTFWCSIVSGIFVFSGLLAFSFADLGISNSEKLSSSLFWRCIGVVVFFYIPFLVVATPMERNLVFLAAVENVHKVNDVIIFEELSSQTQHEKNMKRHVHSQNPFQKEIWAFHVSYLHFWLIGFQRDL